MDTDFACEKRLSELNAHYHTLVKNTVFVLSHTLEKYKVYFPDFTDHTILHSMQVMDFCNRLLGENLLLLNEDELFVLIMSAYLHDSGMGISQSDYKELYDTVVSAEYRKANPNENIRETVRSFHQTFSKNLVYKYADLFEIPSSEHVRAIAAVCDAHRRSDLFDESSLPDIITAPSGNTVRLPYLAALIRLADELDIAADRNIGLDESSQDTIFKMMHRSITHMHILPDKFVFDVEADDNALFYGICREIEKLQSTLNLCNEVVDKRTSFSISQKTVKINRLHSRKRHITVLDSDMGTDDAAAIMLLNILPQKPEYLVASYGNATLENACINAALLKKYFGLDLQTVKGLPVPDDPNLPISEKNDFHGPDGLGGRSDAIRKALNAAESELNDYITFEQFKTVLADVDSITYITIGTLTNLSNLLDDDTLRRKIDGVYVMGGGIKEFNCSNDTEFNFSKDPKSVRKLLTSGLNITLFPLDVTNHQTVFEEDIAELEQTGTYREVINLLRFNLASNCKENGIPAAVLHDTLPVLYQSYPEAFELEDMRIGSDEYAHTFISANADAVHVCVGVKDKFMLDMLNKAFGNNKK